MVRSETPRQKNKQSGVHIYTLQKAPTAGHMVVEGSNQLYPNMIHLFRVSFLIPPSTANAKLGYPVMNLLCAPLRLFLNQASLHRFMQIWINGPESLPDLHCEYLQHQFKHKQDSRCIDFETLFVPSRVCFSCLIKILNSSLSSECWFDFMMMNFQTGCGLLVFDSFLYSCYPSNHPSSNP